MSLTINFLSSERLAPEILWSAYIGDDERGAVAQIRAYANGSTEIRDLADSGWRVL